MPSLPPEPLSPKESQTLTLVCGALLPEDDSVWRASVPDRAVALLPSLPNPHDLDQLRQLLRLLESPAANVLLFGRPKAFGAMDNHERMSTLAAMARHRVGLLRGGFQALKRLAAALYYADADEQGYNPTWPSLGYPGPVHETPPPSGSIPTLALHADTDLDCDVVIVGSGAGGGVMAGQLSAAGLDVIVVERGGYHAESDFDQLEWRSIRRRYLYGGLLSTADQGIGILAGSCLGGGTVINYTTSFRTPDRLRAEWARTSGLPFLTQDAFTRALDAVCVRLNVNRDHNRLSRREECLTRGLQALGWHHARMPRNVDGCTQDDVCGYCGFGCVRGAKRSMVKTYLSDALQHGARILADCHIDRVSLHAGRATGVVGRTVQGHRVSLRARRVVLAAGALETPALLLRSGLNGSVGHHLRLHPLTAVWGVYDEEVRPWTGTIQAAYSDQFADLDDGYGLKLETTGIHPLFMTFGTPWSSAAHYDRTMRQLAHTAPIGLLLRDRSEGRVRLHRSGGPVVDYRVSRYDQGHVRRGIEGAARVHQAAGAREIFVTQNRPIPFQPGGRQSLEDWMTSIDAVGYGSNQTIYFSWHQMGTCRMGASPDRSVVGESGECHSVKDLFVADASLFPSASGVNPMITIAALAHHVAAGIRAQG
jgi:choline dehydrogenase-like flavoprotein